MLNSSFKNALKIISARLFDSQIDWYVTGKTNLNLQGIDIQPKHIGIQIHDYDLSDFLKIFKEFKKSEPIELSNKEALEFNLYIEGVVVLICAEYPHGAYLLTPQKINQIKIENGVTVPCLDLKSEMLAYEKLGMFDRSELIKNFLN